MTRNGHRNGDRNGHRRASNSLESAVLAYAVSAVARAIALTVEVKVNLTVAEIVAANRQISERQQARMSMSGYTVPLLEAGLGAGAGASETWDAGRDDHPARVRLRRARAARRTSNVAQIRASARGCDTCPLAAGRGLDFLPAIL